MKVSVANVTELRAKLKELSAVTESLDNKCEVWLKKQEERMRWGSSDPYWTQLARERLDNELSNVVDYLAWFYDYLHTERRAYEVPTGRYLQSLRNDGSEESGERKGQTSNDKRS